MPIADEAGKRRIGRLEKEKSVDAGLDARTLARELDAACPLLAAAAGEGMRIFGAADHEALPRLLDEADGRLGHLAIGFQEVLGQRHAETLDVRQRMLPGEDVDGILHRVGGDDLAIVAVAVGGVEISFQPHIDAHLDQVVAVCVAGDFRQLNLRFAIGVVRENRGHRRSLLRKDEGCMVTQRPQIASGRDWAIRSRRVIAPDGMRAAAVVIRGEKIAALVAPDAVPADMPVDDVGERVLLPGLVDAHVHINEPGRTEWEGFETATRAAAAGGITTLVDMPLNSSPVTTTVEALVQKVAAAVGKLWVDCGFYGGIVPGNNVHLKPLAAAGVLGFKAFLCHSGIDEFPNATEADLRAAMPILADAGLPLLVHAELLSPLSAEIERRFSSRPRSYADYLATRPRQWEHNAIRLLIELCREFDCRVHIVHLATADALSMIAQARAKGLPLTVETCPHYLCFAAEEISDGDPRFKCAPPIREQENRERLWDGLRAGLIDTVGSDHSPAPPALKHLATGDLRQAWGGIASLQLELSVIFTEAGRRGFSLAAVADWMSRHPAHLVGLAGRKGSLAPGHDADLVVFDPDAEFTVTPVMLHHRHKITPYEGRRLRGRVEQTYVRGRLVYDAGHFAEKPSGQAILRTGES